jgi:peptide/nickel transport system permease protein
MGPTVVAEVPASPEQRRRSFEVFLANRLAVIGLVLLTGFALMVMVHPLLMATVWSGKTSIYDPVTGYDAPVIVATVVETVTDPSTEVGLAEARLSAGFSTQLGDVVEVRQQPAPLSRTHLLGTDSFGRDVFSMLLAGAWPTFVVGVSAAVVSGLLAVVIALASAIFRGRTDRVLGRLADVLLLLPAPLAMIVLAGTSGDFLTPWRFGIAYGILAGASTAAIVVRSHALATIERPFIDAARVSGAGSWHLARWHLLPHLVPLTAVTVVSSVVGAVVAQGFASWLAFSDDLTNWGAMMFVAVGFADVGLVFAWNVLVAGAVAISIFCGSFYLVSLGLQDVAFQRQGGKRSGWAWGWRNRETGPI